MKTIVLGGYGNAGVRISRLLPGITEGEIVLAGRNLGIELQLKIDGEPLKLGQTTKIGVTPILNLES